MTAATACRRRRFIRFRNTALPSFFVTVKPIRKLLGFERAVAPPARTNARLRTLGAERRARKSALVFSVGTTEIRLKGACGPWHDDGPELSCRLSLLCERENRACACEQARSAEMYASWVTPSFGTLGTGRCWKRRGPRCEYRKVPAYRGRPHIKSTQTGPGKRISMQKVRSSVVSRPNDAI